MIFGRLHIDNWTHSTSGDAINFFETGESAEDIQNRTLFRRARLGASGNVNDSMAYKMENFAGSGQISGDTFQPEFAGRIAHTPRYRNDGREYVHLAVAGTVAFPDGDPRNGANANLGRFRTRPEGRTDSRWLNTGRIDGADSYQIAAVEGVWNSGPKIGSGAWQIAARYSVADLSNENIRGGRGESLTLGVNWYFNPNASPQFNYIRGEITERDEVVSGQLFDCGDYEVIGVRMRIDF